MGDELTNLFEIFKRIEKNGGQATLFVSTNAGKTKVKLELTSCSPNKTHLCQVLQLWETSAAVIAARQRRLKPMLEQPCTRQPWPLQLLQLWGMMKNLHHLLLPLLPTPHLHCPPPLPPPTTLRLLTTEGWTPRIWANFNQLDGMDDEECEFCDNHEVGENCYLVCLGSKEESCTKTILRRL